MHIYGSCDHHHREDKTLVRSQRWLCETILQNHSAKRRFSIRQRGALQSISIYYAQMELWVAKRKIVWTITSERTPWENAHYRFSIPLSVPRFNWVLMKSAILNMWYYSITKVGILYDMINYIQMKKASETPSKPQMTLPIKRI